MKGELRMEDRLLKINDCLKIIPIGKSTFYEKVKEGKLPQPVHIDASTFWRYSDLMAFVASMSEPQTPSGKAHSHA
jgi:predicted DNA-binding transcriptional regulator AlpA